MHLKGKSRINSLHEMKSTSQSLKANIEKRNVKTNRYFESYSTLHFFTFCFNRDLYCLLKKSNFKCLIKNIFLGVFVDCNTVFWRVTKLKGRSPPAIRYCLTQY